MTEKKNFTRETLERIRSGSNPESHKKKRKLSRTVLIIDAIIVLLIFIFIYRDNTSPQFYSTYIEYKNCRIRYSINRDNQYKDYHFNVEIKGLSGINEFKPVTDNFAFITLSHKEKELMRFKIGKSVKKIKIREGEIKSFSYTLEKKIFEQILPAKTVKKRRSLIEFEKKLTIVSQLIINTHDRVTTSLRFDYEVPK